MTTLTNLTFQITDMSLAMNEKINLELEILHETHLAVMVENVEGENVWLPKSKIDINGDFIDVPEWLAIEKDLV